MLGRLSLCCRLWVDCTGGDIGPQLTAPTGPSGRSAVACNKVSMMSDAQSKGGGGPRIRGERYQGHAASTKHFGRAVVGAKGSRYVPGSRCAPCPRNCSISSSAFRSSTTEPSVAPKYLLGTAGREAGVFVISRTRVRSASHMRRAKFNQKSSTRPWYFFVGRGNFHQQQHRTRQRAPLALSVVKKRSSPASRICAPSPAPSPATGIAPTIWSRTRCCGRLAPPSNSPRAPTSRHGLSPSCAISISTSSAATRRCSGR